VSDERTNDHLPIREDDANCPCAGAPGCTCHCHVLPGPPFALCPNCAHRSIDPASDCGWCATCTRELRIAQEDRHEAEKARQRAWWARHGPAWRAERRRASGREPVAIPVPVYSVLTRASDKQLIEALAPGQDLRAALETAILGDGEALGRLYRRASSRSVGDG